MSSLLEQAIIDAKILKETARKNAEAALLDQYSDIIKNNIDMLLEQDEPVLPDMAGATAPAAPAAAPPAPDISSAIPADSSAAAKKIVDRVPAAYLGEDNMQEIEINLDSLVEKVDALEQEVGPLVAGIDIERPYVQHGNPTRIAPDGLAESLEEEGQELDEVYELEEEALEETVSTAPAERDVAKAQGNLGVAQQKLGDLKAAQTAEEETTARRAAVAGKKQAVGPETSLAEELEEEGLELEEEIYIDMAGSDELGSHPGGINMNTINLKRQADVDAALEENEELHEELGAKEQEIAALEEKLNAMKAGLQETRSKLKSATETNAQLAEGVKQLSAQFEKVSLLNARLLYTNKTLTNSSLNERQKQQIAESISNAKSVEQAKTIYETLQRSSGLLTERKSAPKSLTEAVSRASSPFLPRSNTPHVDPAAERMRILAGIKK